MNLRVVRRCTWRIRLNHSFKPHSRNNVYKNNFRFLSTYPITLSRSRDGDDIDGKSWIALLYKESGADNDGLQKLRRKLDVALRAQRSHEKGDLLPYLVAQELVRYYNSLVDMKARAEFFNHLAEKLGVDFSGVLSNVSKLQTSVESDQSWHAHHRSLVQSLTPTYKHLFDDISKLEHGTHFLVTMRQHLLNCFREKHLTKTPALLSLDTCLKEHIALWFANGFLDLEVVSWENSPGSLLEKVMAYEAVHVMSGWQDLKSRSGDGRRIFTFSHRLMPHEPLVILHTLLGSTIPNNIQLVLNTPSREVSTPDVTSATFYSVTSTQRGLDGIGLGNLLIKRVVEKLRNEFYNIADFVTLSPIPGFRKWLDAELEAIETSGEVPERLANVCKDGIDGFLHLKKHLASTNWQDDAQVCEVVETPLTLLCVQYLLSKRRGFVLNPVAHFHLRNGACLWRVNWMGNRNPHGLKASYGFMVNYKYDLEHLERNNNNYIQDGTVAVSEGVQGYLDVLLDGREV